MEWITEPGLPFRFRIVCPHCELVFDVSDVEMRLNP